MIKYWALRALRLMMKLGHNGSRIVMNEGHTDGDKKLYMLLEAALKKIPVYLYVTGWPTGGYRNPTMVMERSFDSNGKDGRVYGTQDSEQV